MTRETDPVAVVDDHVAIGPAYPPASAQPHTAIVAEGGGQRGIFTAGVLDAFLQADFNPFSYGIGVSAGAQNLLTYFLGVRGYARRAIAELTSSPGFFVPYRWLGKRGVLDLDMYFARVHQDPLYRLPFQDMDKPEFQRRLEFVATRQASLTPVYLEPDGQSALDYMKASSAVPFLYRAAVTVDGERLFDGGVADPIPVRRAYEQCARRLLVIRTVPAGLTASSWRQRFALLPFQRLVPPDAWSMLQQHEGAFDDALQFMQRPPTDVELIELAPDQPLRSYVFGSHSTALSRDYAAGLEAGESALTVLKRWTDTAVSIAPAVKTNR